MKQILTTVYMFKENLEWILELTGADDNNQNYDTRIQHTKVDK